MELLYIANWPLHHSILVCQALGASSKSVYLVSWKLNVTVSQRQTLFCVLYWISVKLPYIHTLPLLLKCYDLLLLTNFAKLVIIYAFLSHFGEILWFTRFVTFCDLRIFPGKKFSIPGTKNYYAALLQGPFIVPQRKNILHFSEWARMGLHF